MQTCFEFVDAQEPTTEQRVDNVRCQLEQSYRTRRFQCERKPCSIIVGCAMSKEHLGGPPRRLVNLIQLIRSELQGKLGL